MNTPNSQRQLRTRQLTRPFTLYLLQTIALLDLLAVGLIVPLLPAQVRKLGGNEIYVGLLGSIYAGCQLVSGPLIGSLSDLQGRKPVLGVALIVCGLAYAYIGITNSLFIILVIRAVLGIGKQTQVLTRALVADYEKDEHEQADIYGKMAAVSGVGITLGPLIGGHLAEDNPEHGFTLITIFVGLIFGLNSCIVYFLPNTVKKARKGKATVLQTNIYRKLYTSVKQSFVQLYYIDWGKYWDVFMFKALVGFAMGVYYSNYVLYLKTQYNLSPNYTGYVISFQGVMGSISSYFIGLINSFYIQDKDYSVRNYHVFLLLSAALIGLVLSLNVYVYSFWLIPLSMGNAIGRLVTLEMVLKRSHGDHTGTLIGASNSVRSLSGVVSPMVAGLIGQYFGVSYVIYASLCSTSLGVILSYRHRQKLKTD